MARAPFMTRNGPDRPAIRPRHTIASGSGLRATLSDAGDLIGSALRGAGRYGRRFAEEARRAKRYSDFDAGSRRRAGEEAAMEAEMAADEMNRRVAEMDIADAPEADVMMGGRFTRRHMADKRSPYFFRQDPDTALIRQALQQQDVDAEIAAIEELGGDIPVVMEQRRMSDPQRFHLNRALRARRVMNRPPSEQYYGRLRGR